MTELNSMVVVEDNAIEIERQEELKDFLQEQEQQVLEQFKPGTFGCHELLDRTAMVSDSLERFIVSHPACVQNPEWYALARQAAEALHILYQKVGAVHLNGD
ncbi:MAG: hypothetical protein EWV48_06825 [Microcystis aeruginosa Ma_QC_C_20070823_S13]|jgi:hypothetical protein|nr:MAG: hypothetical protein EWV56_14975 [Microcystis aeruginosa Ma_QC_C_20070823_S13D]TRU63920.1 MAG: hypothetical protein EWV48_06825 [Microcystis aeruginosa Ma_QC_C_20070823_S13]